MKKEKITIAKMAKADTKLEMKKREE